MPTQPVVPEAPQVTNQEALHMHNEGTTTAGIDAARMDEIRRWRRESNNPRDFLKKMAENGTSASFPSDKVNEFKKSFGAGKIDAAGNFTGDPGSIEERLFREGQTAVKDLADFQRYAEIMVEARRTGRAPGTVANGQLEGYANYAALRAAALRTVATNITAEVEPEFATVTNTAEIQAIVEERLATDPAFRRLITEGLAAIKRPTTEVSVNAEVAALDIKITELTTQQAQATTEIKSFIRASGVDFSALRARRTDGTLASGNTALDYLVDNYISRNLPPAEILNNLKHDIIPLFPAAATDFLPFLNEETRVKGLEARLAQIDPVRNRAEYDALKQELFGNEAVPGTRGTRAVTNARGKVITPATVGVASVPQVKGAKTLLEERRVILAANPEFAKYLKVNALLSPTAEGSTDPSRVAQRLQEVARVKTEIAEAQTRRSQAQTEGDRATSETKTQRIEQEQAIIDELRGIIPKAIAQTILDRAQAADVIRQRENITNFNTETRQMLDTVRRSMRERGFGHIEAGGRLVRVNNRDLILDDARALATMKDEGLRRLVLLHMGLAGEPRIDDQGNPVAGGGVIENPDHLNARQRAMYDSIFASEGQAIKQKVATDLVASQGFMDKLRDKIPGTDKNGLNTVEWEEFGKYYNNDMKKIVESTQEGKNALRSLEAAGIKPDTKNWTKWLLWLAAIIGGGTTIAAMGGLTTVIPGVAGTGFAAIKAVATGVGSGSGAVVNGG